MAGGSVEIDLSNGGWGGDFSLDSNGDLLLAIDSPYSPTATTERMVRLILTNATLYDNNRNPISNADDMFNPNWGASSRALVGEPITSQFLADLTAQITDAVAEDPGIAKTPAPSVSAVNLGSGLVQIDVVVYAITGQIVTVPSITLGA